MGLGTWSTDLSVRRLLVPVTSAVVTASEPRSLERGGGGGRWGGSVRSAAGISCLSPLLLAEKNRVM